MNAKHCDIRIYLILWLKLQLKSYANVYLSEIILHVTTQKIGVYQMTNENVKIWFEVKGVFLKN